MRYRAMINVPGNGGHGEDDFATIEAAWKWLASERLSSEGTDCPHGSCEKALRALERQDHCGSVHLHTPGAFPSREDVGIIYSVDPMI